MAKAGRRTTVIVNYNTISLVKRFLVFLHLLKEKAARIKYQEFMEFSTGFASPARGSQQARASKVNVGLSGLQSASLIEHLKSSSHLCHHVRTSPKPVRISVSSGA